MAARARRVAAVDRAAQTTAPRQTRCRCGQTDRAAPPAADRVRGRGVAAVPASAPDTPAGRPPVVRPAPAHSGCVPPPAAAASSGRAEADSSRADRSPRRARHAGDAPAPPDRRARSAPRPSHRCVRPGTWYRYAAPDPRPAPAVGG
eukprot:ctg_687.g220